MPRQGFNGKLADPDWRRQRAATAGKSRTSLEHHLGKIAAIDAQRTAELDALRDLVRDLYDDHMGWAEHPTIWARVEAAVVGFQQGG